MSVICRKHRYIFFANPQTASKAIAKTLIESGEAENIPGKQRGGREGTLLVKKHHCTYQMLVNSGLMDKVELDQYFKFTSVRNPYDLLVSRYIKHKHRFAENADKYQWTSKAGARTKRKCRVGCYA